MKADLLSEHGSQFESPNTQETDCLDCRRTPFTTNQETVLVLILGLEPSAETIMAERMRCEFLSDVRCSIVTQSECGQSSPRYAGANHFLKMGLLERLFQLQCFQVRVVVVSDVSIGVTDRRRFVADAGSVRHELESTDIRMRR